MNALHMMPLSNEENFLILHVFQGMREAKFKNHSEQEYNNYIGYL